MPSFCQKKDEEEPEKGVLHRFNRFLLYRRNLRAFRENPRRFLFRIIKWNGIHSLFSQRNSENETISATALILC